LELEAEQVGVHVAVVGQDRVGESLGDGGLVLDGLVVHGGDGLDELAALARAGVLGGIELGLAPAGGGVEGGLIGGGGPQPAAGHLLPVERSEVGLGLSLGVFGVIGAEGLHSPGVGDGK